MDEPKLNKPAADKILDEMKWTLRRTDKYLVIDHMRLLFKIMIAVGEIEPGCTCETNIEITKQMWHKYEIYCEAYFANNKTMTGSLLFLDWLDQQAKK